MRHEKLLIARDNSSMLRQESLFEKDQQDMNLMEIRMREIRSFYRNLLFIRWFVNCNFFDTYDYDKLRDGYKTKLAHKNRLQENLPK